MSGCWWVARLEDCGKSGKGLFSLVKEAGNDREWGMDTNCLRGDVMGRVMNTRVEKMAFVEKTFRVSVWMIDSRKVWAL